VGVFTVDAINASELSVLQKDISFAGGTSNRAHLLLRSGVCGREFGWGRGACTITRAKSLVWREAVNVLVERQLTMWKESHGDG
jgi:hypothetical protein